MKNPGYIYVAQAGAYIKIGHSARPGARIASLHNSSSARRAGVTLPAQPLLGMVATRADEKELHKRLDALRIDGTEWYPESVLSRPELAPFRPFSSMPKPIDKPVLVSVREDLWAHFRALCFGEDKTAGEGLEEALIAWMKTRPQRRER